MQLLPDGPKSPLAPSGSLSLAGQPLWWEWKVLGVGGILLWLLLIAGHGAVTQGGAESGPCDSQVPAHAWGRGEHPGTHRGAAATPLGATRGIWDRKHVELAKIARDSDREGSHLLGVGGAGSAYAAPHTLCKNDTNYPSLQLEALGEKAFTKG